MIREREAFHIRDELKPFVFENENHKNMTDREAETIETFSNDASPFGARLERHIGLPLPFEARFLVAGSVWLIASNAAEILTAARETFQPADEVTAPVALTLSCYVDSEMSAKPPWPQPHFRGLDHLIYAAYGLGGSMLMDLRQRRVIGIFCPEMARDSNYWKHVLLPVLLGATCAAVGITPLHCACVVENGQGLVLAGTSGVGKSTLSVFLSLNRFTYLSDGWTYFTGSGLQLRAWGLPTPLKLLPDALQYFPQLAAAKIGRSLNGELSYEVDPVTTFGVNRSLCCEPHWLVFVERAEGSDAVFEPISSEQAFARFAVELESLSDRISHMRDIQLQTIGALVNRECWVLRHGLSPDLVAKKLSELCGA
jgi:hypothetical protein